MAAASHSLCDGKVPFLRGERQTCGRGAWENVSVWWVGCSREGLLLQEAKAQKAFRRVGCVAGRDAYMPGVYIGRVVERHRGKERGAESLSRRISVNRDEDMGYVELGSGAGCSRGLNFCQSRFAMSKT